MYELKSSLSTVVEPVKVGLNTLCELPRDIIRPVYDRERLAAGIIHIGVGNFHRAHQAWYLHRLMQLGLAQDWAIIGAGVLEQDEIQRKKLVQQDYLTTLLELDPTDSSAEIMGSMIDYVLVEEGNRPLIQRMAQDDIKIVSLTITEGGYYIDLATGQFEAKHPDIIYDAANPDRPRTAFGVIVAALKLRRDKGLRAFTGLSCDNLQGNGEILKQAVLSLARLSNSELADWIEEECSFPNSMVDCIVPATGTEEIALVRNLGIEDAAPVTHESFRQWVIEDDFCAGRPELERVGVIFTQDVHAYESMKIRILNAGHQLLANAGELLGIDTISNCMLHTLINQFFHKVEIEEIAPYVNPVPDMQPRDYVELIGSRFANPSIRDTTRRVAYDGSSRHPGFLLPILHDALEAQGKIDGLSLAEALWARMCAGRREDGGEIEANDPFWNQLQEIALRAKSTPATWLEMRHIYGDLVDNLRFKRTFEGWLNLLWTQGTEATLKIYCAQH